MALSAMMVEYEWFIYLRCIVFLYYVPTSCSFMPKYNRLSCREEGQDMAGLARVHVLPIPLFETRKGSSTIV